jgi:adenylate kinase family enzyme
VYHASTSPLLDLYTGRGVLREAAGVGTPDEVFERLRQAMRSVTV